MKKEINDELQTACSKIGKSIEDTIVDGEITPFAAYTSLLSINRPLAESAIRQLNAYLADKKVVAKSSKEDVCRAKELIKAMEEYIDISSTIINLMKSE